MAITLYEYPPAVDWIALLDHFKEVYSIDLEDVSGRRSPAGNKRWQELKQQYKSSNNLEEVSKIFNEERPERDYRDRHFMWVNHDSIVYINLAENTSLPAWEQEINAILRLEVKNSPAYNADQQTLAVHVDW